MKTGLVLSGGGSRGVAHIGVLQGLAEMGIRPSVISGSSSGALVGALFAAGKTPHEILSIVKEHSAYGLAGMIFSSEGLLSASGLKNILKAELPADAFEKLNIPLFVTATDIKAGTAATFSSGKLYDVLVGSSSFPVLFQPVKHRGRYLLDGGLSDNLPVTCLVGQCDKIIAVNVNKLFTLKRNNPDRLQTLDRCIHMTIADKVAANARQCDLFLEPPLQAFSMFDLKSVDRIFRIGYKTVMENRKELLSWKN